MLYNLFMSRLKIALLGPPDINFDGKPVKTDRRKSIALLAYLAVTGKAHTRDVLATLLWQEYERESAYAYLRRTLWEVNQMLEKGWIEANRDTMRLAADADFELDTAEFESLLEHSGTDLDSSLLEAAIRLYRGDFMRGFMVVDTAPFENWQGQQAEYFRRLYSRALEDLVEVFSTEKKYETALPHARNLLALDPLKESAHRAIMGLLAAMGDRSGAIRQYETCSQILQDELGIPPQPETENLHQAILHGEITGTRKPSGATRKDGPPPISRLPQMPTPFIGRRPEVEQVKSLVIDPDQRLISLIGPGGSGKTRLSIQAASEVLETFPDGVFFASLAPVQNTEALLPTIAKALEFSFYQEEETPRQQLLDFLREKRMLLILDNFEHLLDSSDLVMDILSHAPNVKLMVTSRVRLNVQGEQLFMVTGMRIPNVLEANAWDNPEEQARPFSAIQLFLDRARRVHAGFNLTMDNMRSVLEICRLVQGMPLGLELSAAWLELLSPKEVATEITRSLDFLATDQTDVPDRQRSIRAVFDSSWKLFSAAERKAFLRLCVFVGSFSREAAQQVSGASLKTLLGLTNKSWLQQTDGGRFQLHELMRQYGVERLRMDQTAWREANNRHADYFADFVERQSQKMRGPEQPAGLRAMDGEFESNLKSAWNWLVAEREWDKIIEKILLGLFQFSVIRWRGDDMIPWLRDARLSLESEPNHQEWLALAILGTFEVYCEESTGIKDADPIERLNTIWEIVTKYDLDERMGFWFLLLAGMEQTRNPDHGLEIDKRFEKVVQCLQKVNLRWEFGVSLLLQSNWWTLYTYDEDKLIESLEVFKELGVLFEQGIVYQMLGRHAFQQKRSPAEITGYYEQTWKIDELLGNNLSNTSVDWADLSGMYFKQGEPEKGFPLLHEIQRSYERVGNERLLVGSLNWEGLYAVRYSTFEHALEVRQRSLELTKKLGNQSDLTWHLFELGDVYRLAGDSKKAKNLFEQAHINFERMNLKLGLSYCERANGDIALEEGRFLDALTHYEKFMEYCTQDNHIWSIGQAHAKLALVHAYAGNLKESRIEIHKGLSLVRDWREDELILMTLLAEPGCLKQEGKFKNAIELAALIANHPVSWNETKQQAQIILKSASHNLSENTVHAAIERGKALDLDSVISSIIGSD